MGEFSQGVMMGIMMEIPRSRISEGVLGMKSVVVIIDNYIRVWPHNKLNLIFVEMYNAIQYKTDHTLKFKIYICLLFTLHIHIFPM